MYLLDFSQMVTLMGAKNWLDPTGFNREQELGDRHFLEFILRISGPNAIGDTHSLGTSV